ncbi:hypothetical protein MVEN_02018500 [Mycena venus]|uniref:F-box domain-containing protein n=1 Tax=Mycena venus TaxID=2733690 RepID=A0A8H6XCF0_9AGAR|nr:hypothetical protein MVEN_02018500 [Mycena venus]
MQIPHLSSGVFLAHQRQFLSFREHQHLTPTNEGSCIDSSGVEQVPVFSRTSISSSSGDIAEVHPDYPKGGTLFAAFPVELQVEVFLQFCEIFPAIGKATEGPPLLLRICRAWTELVFRTPQLWTSFTLDLRSLPGPNQTAFLISATKGWLNRSRDLPLSFRLHYPVLVDTASTELMQCILASFPRWRDATLHVPTACLLPLRGVTHGRSSCLRTFSLQTFGNSSPIVLKDLGIIGTQVTELDLSIVPIPTLDECLHILKECVNLRRCSMNAIPLFSSDGLEPLSLQDLEHLQLNIFRRSLSQPTSDPFLAFLHSLFLPALQFLRISWNWNTSQAPRWSNVSSNRFVEFLEQLSGHLETLHVENLPLDAGQIFDFHKVVPSLQCLSIVPKGGREVRYL